MQFRLARWPMLVAWLLLPAGASAFTPQEKLNEPEVPFLLTPSDHYGQAVAIGGGRVVVGAPHDEQAGAVLQNTGTAWAWAYVPAAHQWLWTGELLPNSPQADAAFGASVAINSDVYIAVGAPGEDARQGAAYVFYPDPGGSYSQMARMTPWGMVGGSFEPHPDDLFGTSVALAGDTAVVGSPGADRDDYNLDQGVVYVFENKGSFPFFGDNMVKLLPPSSGNGWSFGQSVALQYNTVAVGAPNYQSSSGADREGRVFIYLRTSGSPPLWDHEETLYPEDPADRENAAGFGYSVAIDANRVLVGSPWLGVGGAAFLFRRGSAGWSQVAKLTGDGSVNEDFGYSVSISGNRIVVGARYDDDEGTDAGAVYEFQRLSDGTWTRIDKHVAPDAQAGDWFGSAVDIDDCDFVVGAPYGFPDPYTTLRSGAAYVWDRICWWYSFCEGPALSCPCSNASASGGCANSTGGGAQLQIAGSNSVAADDLQLTASAMPAAQMGLLVMGNANSQPVALKDGTLCIGSGSLGIKRFPAKPTGQGGTFTYGPGITALSQSIGAGVIQAGDVRTFQAWFRDPSGSCGKGSNLSSAVSVTFDL